MAAVRIEDVKAEGLDVDVDLLAANGFASISEADRYRLKTQGVCAQRQVGVFMLRIRVPGGRATTRQLRAVAALAERYGSPRVHVTTRGGLELHHVRIEDVRAVWNELAGVGLTTKGTCGDTIRNVIVCEHVGTGGTAAALAPLAELLHAHIVAISDATNISRKMNVALACSPACDAHVATSDIGFVADPQRPGTFVLWGAGGLGAAPRLAIELRRGISADDLVAAFDALVAIGKKHGDRSSRAKAKIKMLVALWGEERFRAVFDEEYAAARAARAPVACAPAPAPGRVAESGTIAALVPMGELDIETARRLADVADRFAGAVVTFTPDQNVELRTVPPGEAAAAVAAIEAAGLRANGRGGLSDVVSCVGLEYCPLAVTHAMRMGDALSRSLEQRSHDPRYADFRIHVSGCPHSCAKHQVADIGLAGGMTELEGERVEAYALYVGGNAHERRLGSVFGKKVPAVAVHAVVDALLTEYEEHALIGERFSQTVARVGVDVFFHAAGAALERETNTLPAVRSGRLVVIGNGMTGARFVEELRERKSDAFAVTVLGDEPCGGYNRIMLSGVLGGFRTAEDIVTHPVDWYADRDITLRTGARAVEIDRAASVVRCADGRVEPYDVLVIATGSRPFLPAIPGIDAPHVYAFRTIDDCDRIRAAAPGLARTVVMGGGLLGLEAAAGLRALGLDVTVVHLMPTLMEQQLDREGGVALERRIVAQGIAVRTSACVVRCYDDGDGRGVELADGTRVPGDMIVVCCGIVANGELAKAAGLDVARGIVVDDGLQTSDERIFAIGECAQHGDTVYGLVEPSWEQAATLADRLTGTARRYRGSRVATKLKVAGVNVAALGVRDPRPGDASVSAIDEDGAYRRAIARDGILVGAQVVGDAVAAASFARAFDAGTPLAGSLAAFVFGSEVAASAPAAPAGDPAGERVCICNDVAHSTIVAAIAGGARDVSEIGRVTRAGTGCGTCRGALAALVMSTTSPSVTS